MKSGIGNLVQQTQIIQRKMAKAQEKLAERIVEAVSGGEIIKVVATGAQKVRSVRIDPTVDLQDVGILEDLVLIAVNKVLKRLQEIAEKLQVHSLSGSKYPVYSRD
ncbi:Nucleoid-associated protein Sama_1311 [Desulfovibrionales bacterium]